jgi:hypothetical protein
MKKPAINKKRSAKQTNRYNVAGSRKTNQIIKKKKKFHILILKWKVQLEIETANGLLNKTKPTYKKKEKKILFPQHEEAPCLLRSLDR